MDSTQGNIVIGLLRLILGLLLVIIALLGREYLKIRTMEQPTGAGYGVENQPAPVETINILRKQDAKLS